MSRADADRLDDIRAAIARCIVYRAHLDSAEFGSMACDAVLRNLAVIGEAVKALPEDFRVNPDLIRDIVDNQLAPLLDNIGSALRGGPAGSPTSERSHRGPASGPSPS